ncbi:protein DEHYDRATION-INDUCED 19 homolog 6-like isoform X2 [Durio zibethinus]|uniref:Protein DEHYDRATION-INDUCED 19 homolog 6-like isoform X2 n=1 Tax=Durio zibethinus TaxID=66656 RepID=A0A6P5Y9F7_DURZI|nr:protein DEHYDRATION-INDUCED 19 homolog 6-like isoform X2 [Durio zibethinus]
MDVDFWPFKARSAKDLSLVHAARLKSDGHYDDFERDEDAKACFPCPFCYLEIENHAFCNHLQEEHCFDLKNARRRKSQKSGVWLGSPATLGRELSSFIGSSTGGRGNAHESAPDPLLSPFLCNAPVSDTRDVQRDKCSADEATVASNLRRIEPPLLDKDHEQNTEERRQRAAFVQQLVMSTIF